MDETHRLTGDGPLLLEIFYIFALCVVLPGSLTRSYVQPYKQLLFFLNPGTEIKLAAELQVNGMFPKTCAFHERVWMLKYTVRSLKDALRDEKEKKK